VLGSAIRKSMGRKTGEQEKGDSVKGGRGEGRSG